MSRVLVIVGLVAVPGLAGTPLDGQTASADPVPALVRALSDENPFVRRSAVNALGDIGDPRATDPLRHILDDSVEHVRKSAEAVLGLRPRVRSGIDTPESGECPRLEKEALSELTAALADPDARARQRAALALGNVCEPGAAEALVGALDDSSKNVRQAATYALGRTGVPTALDPLIRLMKDQVHQVRQASVSALGELCDRRALPALIEGLSDPDEHVRQVAASSLGRLADRGATVGLIAATRDEDPHVRQAAVGALGLIHAPRGIETLDAQRCQL